MTFFNVLPETITSGYKVEFLFFLSLICIFFGVSTIITKNPILSVLFLIGLFFSISIYLMMLGLYFLGLSYLLVYVGAISILFLFILMLINIRISELLSATSNSIPLAVLIAITFNYTIYKILPSSIKTINSYPVKVKYSFTDEFYVSNSDLFSNFLNFLSNNNEIAFVTSFTWDGGLAETTHITSIGNIMYTSHLMWLIITSIILLLAMVGAIVITIKQKY